MLAIFRIIAHKEKRIEVLNVEIKTFYCLPPLRFHTRRRPPPRVPRGWQNLFQTALPSEVSRSDIPDPNPKIMITHLFVERLHQRITLSASSFICRTELNTVRTYTENLLYNETDIASDMRTLEQKHLQFSTIPISIPCSFFSIQLNQMNHDHYHNVC